jgi:hypothetical protein
VGEGGEDFCGIKCTNLAISLNTVGMTKKNTDRNEFTQPEAQLIEQLRQHPEMMVRVQSIMEIARNAEGPLKTADEVEELLIEEMRRLGHVTLRQWAIQAEERVSAELKSQDPTVLSRKKNVEVVVCLWVGGGARSGLAQPNQELHPAFCRAGGSDSTGTLATTGTGADGLWLREGVWPGGGKCPGTLWI